MTWFWYGLACGAGFVTAEFISFVVKIAYHRWGPKP